jgi:hypothetical protein
MIVSRPRKIGQVFASSGSPCSAPAAALRERPDRDLERRRHAVRGVTGHRPRPVTGLSCGRDACPSVAGEHRYRRSGEATREYFTPAETSAQPHVKLSYDSARPQYPE